MRRLWWLAGLFLLGPAGCAPTAQDRLRDYNADGLHLYRQGAYAQAAESFEAALALAPDDPSLLYNTAQSHDRAGDAARAERHYTACLQRDANHGAARHGLAALMVRTGRQDEAARMVEDWLSREPERADAYAVDGWLWHQAGDLPRAQARLHQALERDPHNARALVELGLVYEALRRPERALVLYERALARDPNQPDVAERLRRLQSQGVKRPRPD
jgi:Tfp pilus assembly protein PilF